MLDAILVNDRLWISPGVESSPEDLIELIVQATDSQVLEVGLWVYNGLRRIDSVWLNFKSFIVFRRHDDVCVFFRFNYTIRLSWSYFYWCDLFNAESQNNLARTTFEDPNGTILTRIDEPVLKELAYFLADKFLFQHQGSWICKLHDF